jgi:uncharacterized small protein (DUF1192 family)
MRAALTAHPVDSKRGAEDVASMDDDDRPRMRTDAAALLAKESLDPYSIDELGERIGLLKTEIARIEMHLDRVQKHRTAADALFKPRTSS